MKRIVINPSGVQESDFISTVIRVKALIINQDNEILLVYNNHTYQFPGGHHEIGESLEETLIREIKEELGMDIVPENGPFLQITTYDHNYFGTGGKICSKIYYYVIFTDQLPNIRHTNYDELERQSTFSLRYVFLDEMDDFLKHGILNHSIHPSIGNEMQLALKEYYYLFGGMK